MWELHGWRGVRLRMSNDAEPQTIEETHRLQGTRASMDFVQQSVLDGMESFGYGEENRFAVRIAVEEAMANAVLHGHRGDQEQLIEIHWTISSSQVAMFVSDDGRGYNSSAVPDPTADENLTLPSGRGLAMIKAFMTTVHVSDAGRKIEMTLLRSSS
jgi:serine/threonine-protein kinase RsbW